MEDAAEDPVGGAAEDRACQEDPDRGDEAVVVVVVHEMGRCPGREDVGDPASRTTRSTGSRVGRRLRGVVAERHEHGARRLEDEHRPEPPVTHA